MKSPERLQSSRSTALDPGRAIQDKRLFAVGLIAIFYVVVALVTHQHDAPLRCHRRDHRCRAGSSSWAGKNMGKVVQKIDYATIVFFAGLFIIVGAMEHVGLLTIVANKVQGALGRQFLHRDLHHPLGERIRLLHRGQRPLCRHHGAHPQAPERAARILPPPPGVVGCARDGHRRQRDADRRLGERRGDLDLRAADGEEDRLGILLPGILPGHDDRRPGLQSPAVPFYGR